MCHLLPLVWSDVTNRNVNPERLTGKDVPGTDSDPSDLSARYSGVTFTSDVCGDTVHLQESDVS